MKYKNFIFDLYGTLVDIHTDEDKEELWEDLSLYYNNLGALNNKDELKMWYKKICVEEQLNLKGRLSFVTNKKIQHEEINLLKVFQRLYAKKGITPSLALSTQTAALFRKLSTEYIHLYDGVVELLTEVKKNGGRVYLLSNAQQCFTAPELEQLNLVPYFDGILLSSDYQHKKPDVCFYEAIIERYNLDKSESIMIGNDLTTDILGASYVGMDSLYIHSNLSPTYTVEQHDLYNLPTYKILDGSINHMKQLLLAD